ncbi:hypothetical protein ACHAWT_009652 [Skeletonema menzelii]|mmetsp:Transcript_15600/g.25638  ORF Transcript_15600/g.25638 Transcript_15600/m.25638 type:complete len:180 (+) Transcript_15600:82-621(+)
MATNDPKLQPLHKTLIALKEIKSSLLPFLKLLRDDDNAHKSADEKKKNNSSKNETHSKQQLTPHKRAEAEAAVALAVGTLRYMGSRLKGLDRGRKKGDPLRKELDQIRGLLVSLRKIESEEEKKKKNDASTTKEEDPRSKKEVAGKTSADNKKRRSDDGDTEDSTAASGKKNKKQKISK